MITHHSASLSEWLNAIEKLHPKNIEMGLDRVSKVKDNLSITFSCPVVIVGGTNGKGSTCVFLKTIWEKAGYRVGLYTSPHIHLFEERIQINGSYANPSDLVHAFEVIEQARGTIELTFFEYTTLAALLLLSQAKLDVVILEVGLGGRLDATNLVDADVAIVTNVDIDHVHFLGNTKEAIGYEKAGIYRKNRYALYGDMNPPESLIRYADEIEAKLFVLNQNYSASQSKTGMWSYSGPSMRLKQLPFPSLYGENQIKNATNALMAIELLKERLPFDEQAIVEGLQQTYLPGRFEVLSRHPMTILDVAHNPHAAMVLKENLQRFPSLKTYAVFGAMADKDILGVLHPLQSMIDEWFIADLPLERAATAKELVKILLKIGVHPDHIHQYENIKKAFESAKEKAQKNDKIIAFGSFWVITGITE